MTPPRFRLRRVRSLALLAALWPVGSCSTPRHAEPPKAQQAVASAPLGLSSAPVGAVAAQRAADVWLMAGQPTFDDLQVARAAGAKSLLNLRKDGEVADFDEGAAAATVGLEYVHVPFKTPEDLSDDVLQRARAVLSDPARRPLAVHCASGNRVGAVWLAHRVLDDRLAWDAALAEAKSVGLKSPELEERVREYVAAQGK